MLNLIVLGVKLWIWWTTFAVVHIVKAWTDPCLPAFLYFAEWDEKEDGNEAVQQWEDDWDDDDVNDDFSLQLRKELEEVNSQKSWTTSLVMPSCSTPIFVQAGTVVPCLPVAFLNCDVLPTVHFGYAAVSNLYLRTALRESMWQYGIFHVLVRFELNSATWKFVAIQQFPNSQEPGNHVAWQVSGHTTINTHESWMRFTNPLNYSTSRSYPSIF